LRFTHERQKLIVHITKADLAAYDRIRRAKKGKAVVPVRRGACGGCHARVTPQKQLELRQNQKLFTCEHCGRILVSDEIVEQAAKFQ
jgi:predicted  nucleic acid-binding Zn-ribbon protein